MNGKRAAPEFIFLVLLALTAGAAGLPDFHRIPRWIQENAAVELASDFRDRPNEWIQRDWQFRDGVARPKSFGLWRAPAGLTDYRVEFTAQVDNGELAWAWRAQDEKNYYANRLIVSTPHLVFERWINVNGVATDKVKTRLSVPARPGKIYSVAVSVNGPDMVTEFEHQTIDTWSDRQFTTGLPAFFANGTAATNLYQVRLVSRYTPFRRALALLR